MFECRKHFDTMFQRLLRMLIFIIISRYTTGDLCPGTYKGCCPGFSLNSTTQQCEQCMAGYVGWNCSTPCPYPTYGVRCQGYCNCYKDLCDISMGCIIRTTAQAGCITGYVGENCREKCTYPYYGMECQNQCDCDENRCDFSTGCTNYTKGSELFGPCSMRYQHDFNNP
ncbi:multiple epidermal growth factor-like domains protein 10 [Crassostrea angulata]|uniref:multiple epidermal growth factor-like domains protein 10 n=1 Tax=Magallana angulata TaxID=2784310 RepID=UPI0022B0D046|nr:multiple epidermal growth factor-like domains protein 10 [Crassostrea angulata]